MIEINFKHVAYILAGLIAFEFVSWFSYTTPSYAPFIFGVFCLFFLFLCIKNIEYGLFGIILENIVGSKGYLLFTPITLPEYEGKITLSIRLAMFLLFFLVFFVYAIINYKDYKNIWRERFEYIKSRYYILFFVLIVFSVCVAYFRGNNVSYMFNDVNNYLYLALIFPVFFIKNKSEVIKSVITILFAGALLISVKSLFVYLVFGYVPGHSLSIFYKWLRDTGIAEITYIQGPYYRIFFQNHIYTMIAYVGTLAVIIDKARGVKETFLNILRKNKALIFFNIVFLSTLILCLSRSMWLGTFLAVTVFLSYIILKRFLSLKRFGGIVLYCIVTLIVSASFVVYINQLDLSGRGSGFLKDRFVTTDDAAGEARLQLLGPLWKSITENWIIGAGVGKTVTYFSTDPRILAKEPSGMYTTYAFEWGYLDFWLKFGIVGILLLLFLFRRMIIDLLVIMKKNILTSFSYGVWGILLLALLALLFTHITTPYLNHPLGIMIFLIISWIIFLYGTESKQRSS